MIRKILTEAYSIDASLIVVIWIYRCIANRIPYAVNHEEIVPCSQMIISERIEGMVKS